MEQNLRGRAMMPQKAPRHTRTSWDGLRRWLGQKYMVTMFNGECGPHNCKFGDQDNPNTNNQDDNYDCSSHYGSTLSPEPVTSKVELGELGVAASPRLLSSLPVS